MAAVRSHKPVEPGVPLTSGQVARLLCVAPRTVAKWFDTGRLKGYRIPGSADRRVPHAILLSFCREYGIPIPDAIRPAAVVVYGTDAPADVGCVRVLSAFAFGMLLAGGLPVALAVLGDADGLSAMAPAAALVREKNPAAEVVLVVGDDVTPEQVAAAGLDPKEVAARPLDWSLMLKGAKS